MHLHILGICGTFMGGLAAIAKAAGHVVSGCDADVYPPMSTQLAALGIGLTEGYDARQLEGPASSADVFVIGNVVSRGNPLMEEILDRGRPYISGPQWLAENILRSKWVLAVAGTHGKTTTSALLAWILEHAGLEPGFLVGGVPSNFGVSARLTPSPFFVVEADEYDTAFFDKRSKFVHYGPRTAILNNLEFDHADIFADLAAIETQFHHFVRIIPRSGLIVANGHQASLERVLARGCWSRVERFGRSAPRTAVAPGAGSAGVGEHAESAAGSPCEWTAGPDGEVAVVGEVVGRIALDLPGEHNRLNALAALAAARHAGVRVAAGLEALRLFAGVKRRMETFGSAGGVTVYDDFAHHPTAIAATLAGLRGRVGRARILAVFEPRSNTMKRGALKEGLAPSLREADLAFCYAQGLGWDARAALEPLGARGRVEEDLDALVEAVAAAARPGDHVLVMSNGGFGGIHGRLIQRLAGGRREGQPASEASSAC